MANTTKIVVFATFLLRLISISYSVDIRQEIEKLKSDEYGQQQMQDNALGKEEAALQQLYESEHQDQHSPPDMSREIEKLSSDEYQYKMEANARGKEDALAAAMQQWDQRQQQYKQEPPNLSQEIDKLKSEEYQLEMEANNLHAKEEALSAAMQEWNQGQQQDQQKPPTISQEIDKLKSDLYQQQMAANMGKKEEGLEAMMGTEGQAATGPAQPQKRVKGLNKRLRKKKHRKSRANVTFPVVPGKKYCVPKQGLSEQALKEQIDWGCKQGVDCDPIHNMREISCGDQSWFVKAAYVMNYYFNAHGRNETSCDFNNHATLSFDNPSNKSCRLF